jgi:NADH dehydrogenase/NADH:ubiquinone oxidoreductase subunit G
VEEKARGRLIPACTTPVEEGLVVETSSSRVIEARREVLKLLLANHPDNCLV